MVTTETVETAILTACADLHAEFDALWAFELERDPKDVRLQKLLDAGFEDRRSFMLVARHRRDGWKSRVMFEFIRAENESYISGQVSRMRAQLLSPRI